MRSKKFTYSNKHTEDTVAPCLKYYHYCSKHRESEAPCEIEGNNSVEATYTLTQYNV